MLSRRSVLTQTHWFAAISQRAAELLSLLSQRQKLRIGKIFSGTFESFLGNDFWINENQNWNQRFRLSADIWSQFNFYSQLKFKSCIAHMSTCLKSSRIKIFNPTIQELKTISISHMTSFYGCWSWWTAMRCDWRWHWRNVGRRVRWVVATSPVEQLIFVQSTAIQSQLIADRLSDVSLLCDSLRRWVIGLFRYPWCKLGRIFWWFPDLAFYQCSYRRMLWVRDWSWNDWDSWS